MKIAYDYRHEAWTALTGKWGKGALVTLIILLIDGAIGFATAKSKFFTAAVPFFITGPLTVGLILFFTDIFYSVETNLTRIFGGFSENYLKIVWLYFLQSLLIALGLLCFIVPGIILAHSYSMALYIHKDNPNLSATDCLKKSRELMQGRKFRLFCLRISFIGWILLSILTLGVLFFIVIPYYCTAEVAFYEDNRS